MRISDWSSDVCSSDLLRRQGALSGPDEFDPRQIDHPFPARPARRRGGFCAGAYVVNNIETIMRTSPVIPVLVIDDAATARHLAEALVAGGLRVLDVPMRPPAAPDAIDQMKPADGATVRPGTVVHPDIGRAACRGGGDK